MSVPEAAMHEDHGLVLGKGDVGPTGQVFAVKPEPIPHGMKFPPYLDLGFGVLATDPSHDLGALRWGENVHVRI